MWVRLYINIYRIDQPSYRRTPFRETRDSWLSNLCLNNSFGQLILFFGLNQNLHSNFIKFINQDSGVLVGTLISLLRLFLNT